MASSVHISDWLSDKKIPIGFAFLGDSAFVARYHIVHGKIIRGKKTSETEDFRMSSMLNSIDVVLQRTIPSERKIEKWGTRAFKARFGRLRLSPQADAKILFELT